MLIHTFQKALAQGPVCLTRHRIDLISRLVCALIQVRSVNLKKLACSLPGLAQVDSPYRRLQRFPVCTGTSFQQRLLSGGIYGVDRI